MRALSSELAGHVAAWRRFYRRRALLRRGRLLLVPLFASFAHIGLAGWVDRGLLLLLFPMTYFGLLALSLLLWPASGDARDLDRELDAGDALATLLLEARVAPARPLLDRFALARARAAAPAFRSKRLRLAQRSLLLALLLLFAIYFFPGHRPLPGPGSARAGGDASSEAPARGGGGGAQHNTKGAVSRAAQDEAEGEPSEARPPEDAQEDAAKNDENKTEDGRDPRSPAAPKKERVTLSDHVVFPDFRGAARDARRRAPVIERAPGASPPSVQRPDKAAQKRPEESTRPEPPTWTRRRERALARGRLESWEGRFLEYWGAALIEARAGGKDGKASKDGQGRPDQDRPDQDKSDQKKSKDAAGSGK